MSELERTIHVAVHEYPFDGHFIRLIFLDDLLHSREDHAKAFRQRAAVGGNAAVRHLRAVRTGAFDDSIPGAPRAGIDPEDADIRNRGRARTTWADREGAVAGSNARQDLVGYLGIRVHVQHVVQVFEPIDEAHHALGGLALKRRRGGGALGDLAGRGWESIRLELRTHRLEIQRVREHLERAVLVREHVFRPGLQRYGHEMVEIGAGGVIHVPHLVEKVCHRAIRSELCRRVPRTCGAVRRQFGRGRR